MSTAVRDQKAVRAAIRLARAGQKVGIVVDDEIKLKRMLKRLKTTLIDMKLEFEVVRRKEWVEVIVDPGKVSIFAADTLAPKLF